MNTLALSLISAILIGLGATLTFDLWAWFLKKAFQIPPSNICMVGRWLRTLPEGTFLHANIGASPRKSAECVVGWVAHYMIGVAFAIVFVALASSSWLQHPTPILAVAYGLITVLAPFFILQPLFGLGFAASKTPNPGQARLRSVMNHAAFGAGLYLFACLISGLLW